MHLPRVGEHERQRVVEREALVPRTVSTRSSPSRTRHSAAYASSVAAKRSTTEAELSDQRTR